MKLKIILTTILFYSCTQNKYSGYIHDFDSNKPIKNVLVNINGNKTQTDSIGYFSLEINSKSNCIIHLKREGYADKNILRKTNMTKKIEDEKPKNKIIYMFKKESDFSNKDR